MNEEEPPVNRTIITFMMLPDDLIINCLARISRLYYPTLSLVSKRFRFFLASKDLYQTRTLLGRTESCLYVCLQLKTVRWFTLSWKPNSSRPILVPISPPNSPFLSLKSDFAAVGSNIYAISGLTNNKESSAVMVMDCRSHTWHEAPSMQVSRSFPATCVLDGKIYVKERFINSKQPNPMEVFDTKTQTWKFIQIFSEEICEDVKYLALDKEWGFYSSLCMIENVFYRYNCMINNIEWYDHKERLWKILEGLEKWPMKSFNDHHLVDHGGKLAVFLNNYDKFGRKITICCVVYAIKRRQNGDIWGKTEWFDVDYRSNEPCTFMHALSITI